MGGLMEGDEESAGEGEAERDPGDDEESHGAGGSPPWRMRELTSRVNGRSILVERLL
jgi:hypothetical protein